MNRSLKLRLHFLLFVFYVGQMDVLFGQDDYQDGYIITNKKDTIYGQIKDRKTGSFGGIYEKVRFKGMGSKKRFSPKDIIAYNKGDIIYRSMFLDGEKTFLKEVQEGHVSHYIFELQEQGEQLILGVNYLKKGGSTSLTRATQGVFGLKRKRMIQFFDDCPPLVTKIKNKEFKHTYELVDYYNSWIAEKNNTIE